LELWELLVTLGFVRLAHVAITASCCFLFQTDLRSHPQPPALYHSLVASICCFHVGTLRNSGNLSKLVTWGTVRNFWNFWELRNVENFWELLITLGCAHYAFMLLMLMMLLPITFSSTLTYDPTHSLGPSTAHRWQAFVVSMSERWELWEPLGTLGSLGTFWNFWGIYYLGTLGTFGNFWELWVCSQCTHVTHVNDTASRRFLFHIDPRSHPQQQAIYSSQVASICCFHVRTLGTLETFGNLGTFGNTGFCSPGPS
jgi:hypothetical protein